MVAKKTAVQQPATGKTGARSATEKTAPGRTAAPQTAAETAIVTEKAAEKAVAGEPAAGTAADRKTAGKKAAGKKTAARRTAAGKTAVGETVAGRTVAKETVAKKAVAKKAVARKSTGDKAAARDAAGKSTAKKAGAAQAAKQTGATTVVAKKTPGTAMTDQTAVPKARVAAAEPGELAVRPGEDPWTDEEVAEARTELESEMERLREEISSSEASLVGLMRDSGDGAGDDQADTGTKNITREHELALAANAREMLTQTERALERLDAGTYGLCENCGNPIGKARMQAFPRATLCVECKQKQERRS